jgi:predicted dehydrogenase
MVFNPDAVIVANPTSLHIVSVLPFLEKGIKVLIEKPIAYSSEEANSLNSFQDLIRVAYCFRFHPLNEAISKIIKGERIFKVGFKRSYYLPKWHPYADYRSEYTAQKSLGGGVIRTLSHEIDLMINWFGSPNSSVGVTDKISNLEIDTDDYAFFTCKYANGPRVNFELDFLSPMSVNTGELYSEKGKYSWDLSGISFMSYDSVQAENVTSFSTDEINRMYVKQIEDFIGFVKDGNSINTSFNQSIEVLKIIENIDGK